MPGVPGSHWCPESGPQCLAEGCDLGLEGAAALLIEATFDSVKFRNAIPTFVRGIWCRRFAWVGTRFVSHLFLNCFL